MVHAAELQQATPEQLNEQLNQQIRVINSLKVRGLDITAECYDALQTQNDYSDAQGWDDEKKAVYWDRLSQHLNHKPTEKTYYTWMECYADEAKDGRLNSDNDTYIDGLANLNLVRSNAARAYNWDEAKIERFRSGLVNYIEHDDPEPEKSARSKKLAGLLGITAVSGLLARRKQHKQTTEAETTDTEETVDEEKPNKNRRRTLIAGAVIGGVIVAALVDGYFESKGGGLGVRHLFGNSGSKPAAGSKSIQPTHSQLPGTKSPGQSVPSAVAKAANPTNKLPDKIGKGTGSHDKQPKTVKGAARATHQQLRYYGDTIFYHMQHALGKNPSQLQVHKVLQANHLSETQARHLPVGYKFLIPKFK